ncbi:cytochrome c oxidase subunit 4 [Agromyces mariniharenae]|uniref:Cytochrome c oxidase polypeptide 4 n=1 Tax=Agromyces mariniharenae TaxID=2604423 RepID=A0A5S4UXS7_9MICO|nr:cytochrome c oxidase subunit 4 [Agromyces mariniharenae]TYL50938.1 cytochrome c oxidase subunit 4 [Agromyces mariniharenae]
MRANVIMFWILAVFFGLAAVVYGVWSAIDEVDPGMEWAGTVALSLTTVLSAFIAFYLGRVHRAQGAELPEDRLDANIDDGDAELGFFSPWSWWPIILATGAALGFLGLAIGFWITFLAVPLVIIALVGWVYEYYRGNFAR